MSEPQKFTKRPVTIEAIQLTPLSIEAIEEFVGGDLGRHPDGGVVIATLEGAMRARLGDFIIKGVQGEFYPCKPEIFRQTYDTFDALAGRVGYIAEPEIGDAESQRLASVASQANRIRQARGEALIEAAAAAGQQHSEVVSLQECLDWAEWLRARANKELFLATAMADPEGQRLAAEAVALAKSQRG